MGYISNERPDLFLGIIAQVPFVDICNTMLDENLPLTVTEIPEWGDIKKTKKLLNILKATHHMIMLKGKIIQTCSLQGVLQILELLIGK